VPQFVLVLVSSLILLIHGSVLGNVFKVVRSFIGLILINHCFTCVLLVFGGASALIEDS
jgi:hypothetical protein